MRPVNIDAAAHKAARKERPECVQGRAKFVSSADAPLSPTSPAPPKLAAAGISPWLDDAAAAPGPPSNNGSLNSVSGEAAVAVPPVQVTSAFQLGPGLKLGAGSFEKQPRSQEPSAHGGPRSREASGHGGNAALASRPSGSGSPKGLERWVWTLRAWAGGLGPPRISPDSTWCVPLLLRLVAGSSGPALGDPRKGRV